MGSDFAQSTLGINESIVKADLGFCGTPTHSSPILNLITV